MNEFQRLLPKDIDTIWTLVKLLHPTLPDVSRGDIKVGTKYCWVTVQFKVKGYGNISFGIDNGKHDFFGPRIKLEQFEAARRKGHIKFRIWRFVDDKLYIQDNYDPIPEEKEAIRILKSAGYKTASPQELYKYYYSD